MPPKVTPLVSASELLILREPEPQLPAQGMVRLLQIQVHLLLEVAGKCVSFTTEQFKKKWDFWKRAQVHVKSIKKQILKALPPAPFLL